MISHCLLMKSWFPLKSTMAVRRRATKQELSSSKFLFTMKRLALLKSTTQNNATWSKCSATLQTTFYSKLSTFSTSSSSTMPRCWNEVKERKQVSKLLWCLGSRISLGWPRKSRAGWRLKTYRIGSPNHNHSQPKKRSHKDGLILNQRKKKRTCSPSSGSCTSFSQRALITLLNQKTLSCPQEKLKRINVRCKHMTGWLRKNVSKLSRKGNSNG